MSNIASFGETDQVLVFPLNTKPNFPNIVDFFFNGDVVTAPFVDGAPTGPFQDLRRSTSNFRSFRCTSSAIHTPGHEAGTPSNSER